jgi:hypothetical protein
MTLGFSLELFLWLSNTAVLVLIVYRRIYRTFPVFSSYLLFQLIGLGMSYVFREFSVGQNVSLALSFLNSAFLVAVLGELSMSVLRSIRSPLPRWTPLAIAYTLALAYAATWEMVKGLDALAWCTPFVAFTLCLDLSSSGLQIIFFIVLAAVSRMAEIGWRSREMQVAAGLGSLSFVNFWATMIQLNLGTKDAALLRQSHLIDQLRSFGGGCLMLYWVVSFARKEKKLEAGRFGKYL